VSDIVKIRETLRLTLDIELAGGDAAQAGPWSMLRDECVTWRSGAGLNPAILAAMRGRFDDNLTREVLLAAAGVKVSRTCLNDTQLDALRNIAAAHSFRLLASEDRYIHRYDKGKGGAANGIERRAQPDETSGLRNVYVATGDSVAAAARMLEESGDHEIFGLLLGIPQCCRDAFGRNGPAASAKQNDFIGPSLDATAGPMPYDAWLNYAANYFGGALISFFPCSFRCPAAALVARNTYRMLSECDQCWAQRFLDLHRTNILYTEYQGLHLFRRPLADGIIQYGPDDFESTEPTEVARLLRRGNRLMVYGKRHMGIYRDGMHIGELDGEDVGMFAFL
jgi:hypothetical protein